MRNLHSQFLQIFQDTNPDEQLPAFLSMVEKLDAFILSHCEFEFAQPLHGFRFLKYSRLLKYSVLVGKTLPPTKYTLAPIKLMSTYQAFGKPLVALHHPTCDYGLTNEPQHFLFVDLFEFFAQALPTKAMQLLTMHEAITRFESRIEIALEHERYFDKKLTDFYMIVINFLSTENFAIEPLEEQDFINYLKQLWLECKERYK